MWMLDKQTAMSSAGFLRVERAINAVGEQMSSKGTL